MIVTVTPNPSIDRTLEVAVLRVGEVHRAQAVRVEAGGKGVNIARALLANGADVRAVLPVGGAEGEHLLGLLHDLALDVVAVPVGGRTRVNVTLVEPAGRVTKVNAPGPALEPGELQALFKATVAAVQGAAWLAASGSLPPGAPADLYAQLVRHVHEAGARVAVDSSGAPLVDALAAEPDVVKPNEQELAEAVGRPVVTFGDVVDAARQLRERGAGAVLVSLGSAGAVLVDAAGAVHADTPPVRARSNVGAGDAALAGFLTADGSGPEALRHAVAWGAAAVRLPGTAMPVPQDVDLAAVRLHDIDLSRRLHVPE